ncbi:MAG: NPCBM/NEW2 domain-containing protein, partial [Planctomycetales bacterium]
SLYKNFGQEIMLPLADYGGGSGCGGMFVSEPRLPEPYRNALLTCDWGRSVVYYHPLTPDGPTFQAKQEVFLNIPRPTDVDADASGRLYVSSWHGGKFAYSGVNVGYVAALIPQDATDDPVPALEKLNDSELVGQLQSESAVLRLHAQREILQRAGKPALASGLLKLIQDDKASLNSRIAAVFGYKQLEGDRANKELLKLAGDGAIQEWVLRALTDRRTQLAGVSPDAFVKALSSKNPRVRLAAVIGLGRLKDPGTGSAMLSLTRTAEPKKPAPDPAAAAEFRTKKISGKKQVEIDFSLGGAKKLFLVVTNAGDGDGLDHAGWIEPRLVGKNGETKLTEIPWESAESGWGKANVNLDCEGKPLKFNGKTAAYGIGTHAHSVIVYRLPPGQDKFRSRVGLDDGSKQGGSVQFMVFADRLPKNISSPKPALDSDPERVIPHVAIRTLARINAVDACLSALDGPDRQGALSALQLMHDPAAVNGLLTRLTPTADEGLRQGVLNALVRLYFREGPFQGDWWGTRPDTTGPYYHRDKWEKTSDIEAALVQQFTRLGSDLRDALLTELDRHKVRLPNLPTTPAGPSKPTAKDVAVI